LQTFGEEKFRKLFGDPKQVAAELRQFSDDHEWLGWNASILIRNHLNHWVAVFRGRVIGTQEGVSSLHVLVTRLQKQGYDTGKVAIKFLDTNPKPMILLSIA